jgi:acetylglutamate kinase
MTKAQSLKKFPTESVVATLGYVKAFAGRTILIKLGGAALQDEELVRSICDDLTLIRSIGVSLVLVHGGGPSINAELESKQITWEFIDGQRKTSSEMMDVIEMVLCGRVNRRIVRTLNHAGVRAVGLSGPDAATLMCRKANDKLGQVGVIEEVDATLIQAVMNAKSADGLGAIPVIAPVGMGGAGEAFNINADWAASRLSQALGINKLLFLTDQDGILDGKGKLVPELDAGELENLIETGVVKGGMLAKAQTILHALRHGVTDVHVINARRPHALIEELFTDRGVGTVCRLRSRLAEPAPLETPAETPVQEARNG